MSFDTLDAIILGGCMVACVIYAWLTSRTR